MIKQILSLQILACQVPIGIFQGLSITNAIGSRIIPAKANNRLTFTLFTSIPRLAILLRGVRTAVILELAKAAPIRA